MNVAAIIVWILERPYPLQSPCIEGLISTEVQLGGEPSRKWGLLGGS